MNRFFRVLNTLFNTLARNKFTALILAFSVLLCAGVFLFVDLKPKVEQNFFFSSTDPQLQAERILAGLFPQPYQFVISVKGEIQSPEYLERMDKLSSAFEALPDVIMVQSLARGPKDAQDAEQSPLWKRVVVSEDGESSFVSIFVKETDFEKFVIQLEEIKKRKEAPGFEIMISGAPYIAEQIRRHLFRDLKIFTTAAMILFGLVVIWAFRSFLILTGILVTCLDSSALTLLLAKLLQIEVGPLTANLSTIVFVLTLSHLVFFTFNWRLAIKTSQASESDYVRKAMDLTIPGSFWSMIASFLGFASLLLVESTPMKQLGISGAVGTVISFAVVFLFYPFFLLAENPEGQKKFKEDREPTEVEPLFKNRPTKIFWIITIITCVAAFGIWRINTDPSLLSYFKKGSDIREGVDYIDKNGGSSPLLVLVADPEKTTYDTGESYKRLWELQLEMEKDPAVGSVISLPVILAEARRVPFSGFVSTEALIEILSSPKFGGIADFFITKDRKKALYLLRMKENGRTEPRVEIVERIKKIVSDQKYSAVLVGGAYFLQGKMSELLTSSMISGISQLTFMCMIVGWLISRSLKMSIYVGLSILMVPVLMLGFIGFCGMPVDIISAPSANLAVGLGVDSMCHLLIRVIRLGGKENMFSWKYWSIACSQLSKPIFFSDAVLIAGFGIFMLSFFPPTQRFGFFIVIGTILSPISALFLLPWLATLPAIFKRKT